MPPKKQPQKKQKREHNTSGDKTTPPSFTPLPTTTTHPSLNPTNPEQAIPTAAPPKTISADATTTTDIAHTQTTVAATTTSLSVSAAAAAAPDKGYSDAQVSLGIILIKQGDETFERTKKLKPWLENNRRAFELFMMAVQELNKTAISNATNCYLTGQGCQPSATKAEQLHILLELCKKSERGDPQAQMEIALMYRRGFPLATKRRKIFLLDIKSCQAKLSACFVSSWIM